jgi:hypothetical protein
VATTEDIFKAISSEIFFSYLLPFSEKRIGSACGRPQ